MSGLSGGAEPNGKSVFDIVRDDISKAGSSDFKETVQWASHQAQNLDKSLDGSYNADIRSDLKEFNEIVPHLSQKTRLAVAFWGSWCNTLSLEISSGQSLSSDLCVVLHDALQAVRLMMAEDRSVRR